MSWRERYQQASFRGASFYVESAEGAHGRRQAVHEHAQRDVPYTEDMGRKAREFTIDGYVIGEDYDRQLLAIISACETAGAGQLVHPYRGGMTVVCRGLTTRETSSDGRMARITITFLEAGEASFPRAFTDNVNAISGASNSVTAAAVADLLRRFTVRGFPSFVRDAATQSVVKLTTFLLSPKFKMTSDYQVASDFHYSVVSLQNDAAALVLDTPSLVSRLKGVMTSVRSAYTSNSFAVLTGLNSEFSAAYAGTSHTPSRMEQRENFESFGEFVRQVAVAEAAKQAVITTYDSYQEAIKARDTLLDQIDTESERIANDDVYVAMNGLRSEIVRGIPKSGERLPQILQYIPRSTLPSLVIAHSLYGDASREADIVTRNKPRHPGFMIGGQSIEVLSNG